MFKSLKIDKGFELIYWNLSYRRKFIRTLWALPLGVLSMLFIWYIGSNIVLNTILTIGAVIMFFAQLIFTFHKWKK